MADIVNSMFGPTPYEIAQKNIDRENAAANAYGQMGPYQAMRAGQYKLGSQLGGLLGGAIGLQEPGMEEAQQNKAIQNQIDYTTPEGLMAGAKLYHDAGNAKMSYSLVQAAQAKKAEAANLLKAAAQTRLAEVQATELPQMRHEEAMARLAQQAEAARQRSADMRFSIEQRAEAAKESVALRRELANLSMAGKTSKDAEKQEKKEESKKASEEDFDATITSLRDLYNQLETGEGIVSTEKGAIANLKASASSSGIGQFAGGLVGTKNQSARQQIYMQRPLLLQNIKSATGMSAKQMDSDAELKLWLSVATDPKKGIEANRTSLDLIEKMYGPGGPRNPKTPGYDPKAPVPKATNIPTVEKWVRDSSGKLVRSR